ncbi:MAG: glutamate racemase [Paludibacter sp.]|nr:glutamate racemase [Bacteroidales bacterium]MCM1069754.1 glutamate racemase [Prevotella sp.]MCM1354439.1 glutamate racemase [Bacteroides sp.]MCM1443223.1 glutamate racemase [Muribaculum sp.]MCM1482473.1 glutamate racemase [Paludibacter sp.]
MIGVFDSGYGGLTVLEKIRHTLPEYDYLYLGDNARTPYGTRSFEVVYEYTRQCVDYLFRQGCTLVVLACNTASAKALRTIQQNDLPLIWQNDRLYNPHIPHSGRRVLGVIRPTAEAVGNYTQTRHIGILATPGTVTSDSYPIEIEKLHPDIRVSQQACPLWVPIIEAGEHNNPGADWFVQKYIQQLLSQDSDIDTIILGCTHYPLLINKIKKHTPSHIHLLTQGDIVARSLKDYLSRHADLEHTCSKNGTCTFLTTESSDKFSQSAQIFLQDTVIAQHIEL